MSERGIIFYNCGTAYLPRLAVSLMTLRDHYAGPVAIISEGDESNRLCRTLCDDARLRADLVPLPMLAAPFPNYHFLAKCRLHELTPFVTSLFIDSDTIIRGDVADLFPLAERHEFVVPRFSNWTTAHPLVSYKIRDVRQMTRGDAGPAVSVGVFAFTRGSQFMREWFPLAARIRNTCVPDEAVCQAEYRRHSHRLVSKFYNASCRYDDCADPRVRVVHFHGSRHCRPGLPFNGALWVEQYERAREMNAGGVREWAPAGDVHLRNFTGCNPCQSM